MPHSASFRRALRDVTLVIITVGVLRAGAQELSAPQPMRFEVAAVKTSASPTEIFQKFSGGGGPMPSIGIRIQPGGRLMASAVNLQSLILRHSASGRINSKAGRPG